jgi:hypothetical protein
MKSTKASLILRSTIFQVGLSNSFEKDCDENIETPIPKDMDANGNPLPMNVRERQDFNRALRDYKELDKIAYARIMKACRFNPKTKLLCESAILRL